MANKNILKEEIFGSWLVERGRLYGDAIAVCDENEELSYEELTERVAKLAGGLKSIGIKKGDCVLIQLPNCIAFIEIFFALAYLGAIPVTMLPAHRSVELEKIGELSQAVLYMGVKSYLGFQYEEMVNRVAEKMNHSMKVIWTEDLEDYYLEPVEPDPSVKAEDIGVLLLSGGTTGIPKLIPRTNGDYLYVSLCNAERCKLTQEDVFLATTPIAHNFTLSSPGLLGTFWCGGKLVLCPAPSPDEIFPLIEEEEVTITAMVPAMVAKCLEARQWDVSDDISTVRLLQVGGSVLDSGIARRIRKELGWKLQQVYGTAEGLICMTAPDDTLDYVLSCQGRPVSSLDEVVIRDEDGKPLPLGSVGELTCRGPYTIHGYYKAEEVNKLCFTADGFYMTGDKAYLKEDGSLVVLGRVKEQINRAGEKIMPIELEKILAKYKKIREVSVIGVPDQTLGHRICICLIPNEQKLSSEEVNTFLKQEGVADYKLADQIMNVEVWPLTSVGKIDKKKLVEMAKNEKN